MNSWILFLCIYQKCFNFEITQSYHAPQHSIWTFHPTVSCAWSTVAHSCGINHSNMVFFWAYFIGAELPLVLQLVRKSIASSRYFCSFNCNWLSGCAEIQWLFNRVQFCGSRPWLLGLGSSGVCSCRAVDGVTWLMECELSVTSNDLFDNAKRVARIPLVWTHSNRGIKHRLLKSPTRAGQVSFHSSLRQTLGFLYETIKLRPLGLQLSALTKAHSDCE